MFRVLIASACRDRVSLTATIHLPWRIIMSEQSQMSKSTSTAGIILGILTIVLGIVAIGAPLISGLAITFLVAVVLLVAGVTMLVAGSAGGEIAKTMNP